ncbi:MAG TPA: hypothetical protein GXX29_00840 [Firmicutes bacterium]|nr:hypothetical protein [Bacillota bacterium]
MNSLHFTRRRFLTLVVWLMLTAVACGGEAYDSFFAPAVDWGAEANLPADKVFPQGRIFPFGGYSGIASREAANFFTLHGPAYGDARQKLVPAAEASGMYTVYTIGLPMNFLESGNQPKLNLTAEEIAAAVKSQVDAVKDSETIAWWYIQPEELRPWRDDEMAYLDLVTRTIRENDPLGRPIWMYDPGHRPADHLAVTARYLDIVGKGMYTNYSGQKGHRCWVRWTIEQQSEAIRRSGDPGKIQIAVPEMFQEPGFGELVKVPSWVRHDVYLALIMGAQGVVPFSLATRSGFSQEAWNAYYNAYARTARELNGELQLGQVFLFGERRHDLALTIIEGEPVVSPQIGTGGISETIVYPSVAMANIAYGRERYVFLANSSEAPVTVRIDGFPSQPVYARDVFTSEPLPPIASSVTISMAPLGVAGLLLSAPPDATADRKPDLAAEDKPSVGIGETAETARISLHPVVAADTPKAGAQLTMGYVWMKTPVPGEVVDSFIFPLEFEVRGLDLSSFSVAVNGRTIYEGADLPTNLYVKTTDLLAGVNLITVSAGDKNGFTVTDMFTFTIDHLRFSFPQHDIQKPIKGDVPFALAVIVPPEEVSDITIDLISIEYGERKETFTLYKGTTPPPAMVLPTTAYADGAYDLEARVTSTGGITSSLSHRLVVDNWVTMEDEIRPPTQSWLGTIDQLLAVERSSGWEFVVLRASPFGDGDRIRRRSGGEEYIVWRQPRLRQFLFTIFAREAEAAAESVSIAVSADGREWREISYASTVSAEGEYGLKLELQGEVPAEWQSEYIRFSISGGFRHEGEIELGHIMLTGEK